MIAAGRVLTGRAEEEWREGDFGCATCAVSRFERRGAARWECVLNGDCTFLPGGEERGWVFNGDEGEEVSGEKGGPGSKL